MTVAEMCADLPSSDVIFEASSSADFLQLVATSAHFQPQTHSLRDVVALFLQDEWSSTDVLSLVPSEAEHLTTIMFGKSLRFGCKFSLLRNASLSFSNICCTYWAPYAINPSSPSPRD
jgi:hypothetical protein